MNPLDWRRDSLWGGLTGFQGVKMWKTSRGKTKRLEMSGGDGELFFEALFFEEAGVVAVAGKEFIMGA